MYILDKETLIYKHYIFYCLLFILIMLNQDLTIDKFHFAQILWLRETINYFYCYYT